MQRQTSTCYKRQSTQHTSQDTFEAFNKLIQVLLYKS